MPIIKNRVTHSVYFFPVALSFIFSILILIVILIFNNGVFTYTLDDPYIHLALARNIYKFHYGITAGEVSSPSSSIIWTFILSIFGWTHNIYLFPLILNLAFNIISVIFLVKILQLIFEKLPNEYYLKKILRYIPLLLFICFNLAGICFTGMEHSLQILISLVVLYGIIVENKTSEVKYILIAALILGPLVRFENLGITVSTIIYLLLRRQLKPAIISGIIAGILTGLFIYFIYNIEHQWLPDSVIVKTRGNGNYFIGFILNNFLNGFKSHYGRTQLPVVLLFSGLFIERFIRGTKENKTFTLWVLIIVIAHLAFGKFGVFGRYELYVFAVCLLSILYLYRELLISLIKNKGIIRFLVFSSVITFVICFPYFLTTILTPWASRDIYRQQYQMAIFAQNIYKQPVGVNDIGLVTFDNNNYVLDLFGLSNKKSFDINRKQEYEKFEQLAASYNVGLIMVYKSWFPRLPVSWKEIGNLKLKNTPLILGKEVTFYVTDVNYLQKIKDDLKIFQKSLPDGVVFEFAGR